MTDTQPLRKPSPFAEFLDIKAEKTERGHSHLQMRVRPEMCNSAGSIHGGIIAAMADSTAAAAVLGIIEEDEFAPTTQLNISFCNPVEGEGILSGCADVVLRQAGTAWVQWKLLQKDRTVACGSASFRILQRKHFSAA